MLALIYVIPNRELDICTENNQIILQITSRDRLTKDKNIENYGYISTSILWIYQIYWKKILIDVKLIKIYKNIRKTL